MGETGSLRRSHEVDRRRFLRRAAVIAWAAPVVATLGSGPAYAQTCVPAGDACGTFTGGSTCSNVRACCTPTLSCKKDSNVMGTPCICK